MREDGPAAQSDGEAPPAKAEALLEPDSSDSDSRLPAAADEHDAMLFDPDADDSDERAVAEARGGRTSDAILSCPACFATLCVDCQAHARDESRYRAMFVQGCRLLDREGAYVVLCEACESEVGVYDEESELYEFEGVVASEA